MNRKGKCSNYAGCLLAYRGEEITITEGDFVCPECKQTLVPSHTSVKKTGNPAPIIAGIAILAFVGFFIFSFWTQCSRISPETKSAEKEIAATQEQPAVTPTAPPAVAEPITPAPSAPVQNTPATIQVPETINMDLADEENRQIKREVLRRIDLMPTISAENKDKLYISVERARQMGKIITIPFASGQSDLTASDIESLKAAVETPTVKKLLEDPTLVLVILGYADTKGDEKVNLRISENRANVVLEALRDKVNIINVMHTVGMGGSTLFGSESLDKNRTTEVWAVLP